MPHPLLEEQLYLADTQSTLLYHIREEAREQTKLIREQTELLRQLANGNKQEAPTSDDDKTSVKGDKRARQREAV